MSMPDDLAWRQAPSMREVTLWSAAALVAVLAHGALAYAFFALTPEPPPRDAVEQALEIDLSPLAVSTPEAVESEMLDDVQPPDALSPVEPMDTLQPVEEEAVPVDDSSEPLAQDVPPERIEQETASQDALPVTPDLIEPVRPRELTPVDPEPLQAVQPDTDRVAEAAPAVEPTMTEPAVVAPVPADVVLPVPDAKPAVRPEPRPEKPRRSVVAKEKPRKKVEQPRKPAPKAATASKASQKSQAAKAPTVSPARWQARVLSWINKNKRYPVGARSRGEEGTAKVSFSIDASGRIVSARVTQSSGSRELDRAALEMVRRSSPVPAPPPDIAGPRLTLSLPVNFSLK